MSRRHMRGMFVGFLLVSSLIGTKIVFFSNNHSEQQQPLSAIVRTMPPPGETIPVSVKERPPADNKVFRSPYVLPAPWTAKNVTSEKAPGRPQRQQHVNGDDEGKEKLVLFYNIPGWFFNWVKGPHELIFRNCSVDSCKQTADRRKLGISDAVLFHLSDIPQAPPTDFRVPPGHSNDSSSARNGRPPGQRWVAFNMEPPHQLGHISNTRKKMWASAFNWTMSYQTQSDIFTPYNMLVPRETLEKTRDPNYRLRIKREKNYTQMAINKRKTAAWFASACSRPSQRLKYVHQLQKLYPVDVYGSCGPLRCKIWTPQCLELLDRDYKFYLSFESALCADYVTEKLFRAFEFEPNVNVVPVVRGGADYKKYFPPGTYIDAADFASASHLARYLRYLDEDEKGREEYVAMLREGDRYRTVIAAQQALCKLCEKLHTDNKISIYTSVPDLSYKESSCRQPTDI